MMAIGTVGSDGSVKDRLIRAADAALEVCSPDALQMEAIAKRAGVSRSTAFRQLHSISEVLMQVALRRSQRHVAALRELMSSQTGVFAKIEAALLYNARELPADPSMAAVIARNSASVRDPRVHAISMEVLGPVLQEGQGRGEIRTDVRLDELVDYFVEQTWLAAQEVDRSEEAVRNRFRQFVIPALESRGWSGGEYISRIRQVEEAVSTAKDALDNLTQKLHGARSEGLTP